MVSFEIAWPHGQKHWSSRIFRFAVFAAASVCIVAAVPADARQSLAIAAPYEVSESPAGNYLAALVANAERDTSAAASFFREALRADPGNTELVERSFIAALANGNMPEAFGLAQRRFGLILPGWSPVVAYPVQ